MNEAVKLLETIHRIAKEATTIAEYRALVAEAAQRGDLDVSVETYKGTAERVDAFISGDQG